MKKPNFFIIGAPKSGTTSLARWIDDHPNGFLSKPKEPYFFNTDIGPRKISALKDYEALFSSAGSHHISVGEGSTIYLQSAEAVENILAYQPEAKFIVMLRNPLDMVVSMHNQEIRSFNEDITDFEQAWRAQDARKAGRNIPKDCIDPVFLQYRERACIGTQLQRIKQIAPEGQLQVFLFDDLVKNPGAIYSQALNFLELPYHERKDFSPENTRGLWRSGSLQKIFRIIDAAKKKLKIRHNTGMLAPLGRWNRKPVEKTTVSLKLRQELVEVFKKEIDILRKECKRDLSHWLEVDNDNEQISY
jgi:hypothetical protein